MKSNDFYNDINEDGTIKNEYVPTSDEIATVNPFVKVFLWMFVAVLLTFVVGLGVAKLFEYSLYSDNVFVFELLLVGMVVSFIAEIILTYKITKNANRVETVGKAKKQLIIYSILNGISFSILFAALGSTILISVFGFVSVYFLILAGLCAILKVNLEKTSKVALAGLLTLLFSSILVFIFSIFVVPLFNESINEALVAGISILGLVVFTIITIVDIKSIKLMTESNYNQEGYAIIGAFNLYLDFINIFIYIIRILLIVGRRFGRRD